MIISSRGPNTVDQVYRHFLGGNLFLSPEEYQRENAWDLGQKQLLIDTIFRGFDIPKFYLWRIDSNTLVDGYPEGGAKTSYRKILDRKRTENDDPDPYVFEVVDGQQRIRTILEYMGAKPPSRDCYRGTWHAQFPALAETPIAKDRHYNQLNVDQQLQFGQYSLSAMILEKASIDEIRDMFLRLQNGTPLNAQQKRDAMGSEIGRIAREIADLQFFATSVSFDNSGASHRLVASQLLQLELKEKIVSCTSRQLDKLYEQYKSVIPDASVVIRTRRVIGLLGKMFPKRSEHLNQNYALSLYWAISEILRTYEIPEDQLATIRNNFENLDITRLEAMDRDYSQKPQDVVYEDLTLAMSRGNTGLDGISTRHNIICQYIFDGATLRLRTELDPQRNYTHEEKLILYQRAKSLCQLGSNGKQCGRSLDFDDAVVDHISPHSKGGRTSLENGRISLKSCNIARGIREDFNPDVECQILKRQQQVTALTSAT
jgi:5-methylcytosine-specific restriction endonuclease McrA